ncbi:MAG TPA: phospholipid carrier-dependent glycosyltransferase [Streptosporangiaceae bacterium]|jgi:dolichyl-phosphate-mannose--protein O-mannosyl transferase|nr:phospholipid carrier-dependent glycosyltransferase [Streptosporangiaceae bacterium]
MAATEAGTPATETTARASALSARLVSSLPADRVWGWIGPLLVTAFGAFLRFDRLAVPHALIFDETYYAKDAFSILNFGVEHNFVSNANALIQAGSTHIFAPGGEYVVMPPLGKILIAAGEWIFGLNSFGWRFSAAVFGSLAILLICRITRRMTRSTLLGCIAGLLMSLDGLEFVMSRTGLLDIFLMFFVLAAFGCLVIDRDVSRARLARAVAASRPGDAGPELGIRWWRVAAGFLLGCACACKWDGIWYIVAFAGLAIAWDIGARRTAGISHFRRGALVRDGKWLPITFAVLPAVVYIASWSGWFVSSAGYDRNYAASQGIHTPVISALYSLYEYHVQMLQFGVGLHTHHPYESQPWNWLVLSRPVAYYYTAPASGAACSVAPHCSQEVLAIGTPAIWWASIPALIFCLIWWLLHRDWRPGAVTLAVAVGWLTWFPFVSRTKFYYYATEFEPFLILAIVLCIGLIIGSAHASVVRRSVGAAVSGAYLLIVLLNFIYLYPILAAKVIPYASWLSRMWYHGWI